MVRVVVVLDEPFTNLSRGRADHWIKVHVVTGFASESLDPNRSLLQLARVAKQRLLNCIREKYRITLAVGKQRVRKEAF